MSSRSGRLSSFITHFLAYVAGVIGALVVAVVGNFATVAVQNKLSPPLYSYVASRPGCDATAGWHVVQATMSCLPGSMKMQVSPSTGTGEAIYASTTEAFPADYRVNVQISGISSGSCAGVLIRGNLAQATGYAFFICSLGTQDIFQVGKFQAPAKPPYIFREGILPKATQNEFAIEVATQGAYYNLYINGEPTDSLLDHDFSGTENIDLLVSPSGSAMFANFSINELRPNIGSE